MKLVIDTNIVFSALLNPNSTIGDLLLNYQDEITYFAPELLLTEIDKYASKIQTYSKLNKTQLAICKSLVLNSFCFRRINYSRKLEIGISNYKKY